MSFACAREGKASAPFLNVRLYRLHNLEITQNSSCSRLSVLSAENKPFLTTHSLEEPLDLLKSIPVEKLEDIFTDLMQAVGKEIDAQMQFTAGLFIGADAGDYIPLERKDFKEMMWEAFEEMHKVTNLIGIESGEDSNEEEESEQEERSAQANPEGEHTLFVLSLWETSSVGHAVTLSRS